MRYILAFLFMIGPAWADCTTQSTGLKYVNKEGSGLASAFFVIPLLALAPFALATATDDKYRCHVTVIGSDAVGAYNKKKGRPTVTPQ